MARSWIAILVLFCMATNFCSGFATNRSDVDTFESANSTGTTFDPHRRTSESVSSTETTFDPHRRTSESANSTETTFDPHRRTSVGLIVDEKIPTTDSNNASRHTATKEPSSNDENCSSCSDDPIRNNGTDDDIIGNEKIVGINVKNASELDKSTTSFDVYSPSKNIDVTLDETVDGGKPRNVVLMLVDDTGLDRDNAWKTVAATHDFSVEGFLQNCRSKDHPDGLKVSLGDSLVSDGTRKCDCERFLRANVGSLLASARHVKHMMIGVVSATNFSLPSSLGYASVPIEGANELDDKDDGNSTKKEIFHRHAHPKREIRSIDVNNKMSSLSSSTPKVITESVTKPNGPNGYDGVWDVFDTFWRMRLAFFRALMERIGLGDAFSGREPFMMQPSVTELVANTIRELKSAPNDDGFMMVVAVPGSEFPAVVQVLRNEVSAKDTLFVISGMCSDGNETIPFFANGPGGKALREARDIWDLPLSMRRVVSDKCRGKICKNKRNTRSRDLPSLESISFPHDYPRKRVARAKENDGTMSPTGNDKTAKNSVDVETNTDAKTTMPELKKRSGESVATISKIDSVTSILGILTSIITMLTFNC